MSADPKAVARLLIDIFNRGTLDDVDGVLASNSCMTIDRIAGGRIVESFELFAQLGMFQAIGTVPAVAQSA